METYEEMGPWFLLYFDGKFKPSQQLANRYIYICLLVCTSLFHVHKVHKYHCFFTARLHQNLHIFIYILVKVEVVGTK